VIALRGVAVSRGAKRLVADVDVALHAGQKVGLVGANGSGKSTLFSVLTGAHHADAGDVDVPAWMTIGTVAQEIAALDRSALAFVLDGDARYRAAERAIAEAESLGVGDALAAAHAAFDEAEGYAAPARAARLMAGLGFGPDDGARAVAEFSGGWRVRLALAQALASRADLLLLDEPTNHLDLEAVLWLEDWLRASPGSLIVISHDRDFLDAIATDIWHIEGGALKRYAGNYSAFERQRAEQLAVRNAMHAKQQREIAHLQSFVDRFRAKATKARAAQSRIKALARMEIIAAAHVDAPFSFSFAEPRSSARSLLKLEGVSIGYSGVPILSGITFEVERGARIALLGANGAGKSTLVKLLAGELAPLAGERHEAEDYTLGYFAQHQLEQLRGDESPLQHLIRADRGAREQELRDFLGGFDFRGEQADTPIAGFSGGEKARLALALIVRSRPDVLLLDEPTNHLDLEMRHALTLALQEYEGALVLVSHDRHLLRTSADRFMLVSGGTATWFDGDLDDYRETLRTAAAESAAPDAAGTVPSSTRRDERRRDAEQRQAKARLRKPLETELRRIESRMETLEREKRSLEASLADEATYRDRPSEEIGALVKRQGEVAGELETIETRWLELQDAIGAIDAD
jgi:ATP-binding cassette, subfamily F, member 3